MGINEPAMERLIKGTFLMESQLEYMYDTIGKKYGLMMLSEDDVERIYKDFFPFNKRMKNKVRKATYIDVEKITLDEFKELLKTNITLMVCATYIYYMMENKDLQSADIVDIASYYAKNYVKTIDIELEKEFIEYYRETFL